MYKNINKKGMQTQVDGDNQKFLFVSIVVCTLNGSRYIKECIQSLKNQSYPKDRYEIIVVDDGSVDNTKDIAQAEGVQVIRHEVNRGIPIARNAGLKAAQGEIVAYIDGDCVAAVDWLVYLLRPFRDSSVVATGGRILGYKTELFSERYLTATGYGLPASLEFGKSKNPLQRFIVYLKTMFSPLMLLKHPVEVQAVYTANAAYRLALLKDLNGFDENLHSDEDADMSSRLRKTGGHIIYAPFAEVFHRHHEEMSQFIKQTYRRTKNTVQYYSKENKSLPVYPFPVLYAVIAFCLLLAKPILALIFIVVGPALLYCWWLARAVRENSFEYVFYGYVQLAVEGATVLGLLRGPFRDFKNNVLVESLGIGIKTISFLSIIWTIITTCVAFDQSISAWIATPIVIIGAVFVPGFLLAILLGIRTIKVGDYVLYSLGLGLGYLIIGGLCTNLIFPYINIRHPLALFPLMTFIDLSILGFAMWALNYKKDFVIIWKPKLPNITSLIFGIIPIVFVLVSVMGGIILNNFGSGVLTLIMLFAISAYMIILISIRGSIESWVYVSAIYFISLAMLLMYSLRSAHIIGWDINAEYEVFQVTLKNLVWKMSYFPGLDYNACMSITILPAIFQQLTHIPSEYVFKLLYQMLFALTPVGVYMLARRYVVNAFAFVAAFLFVSQTWFYEQMPALIRQETAFFFYILLLMVLFDKQIKQTTRAFLLYIFTTALILSHYSTAYTWLTLMFGVLILSYGSRFFSWLNKGQKALIKPTLFIVSLLLLFIWEVPVTHTAGAVNNFLANSNGSLEQALDPSVIKNALLRTLFVANDANTDANVQLAAQSAVEEYGAGAGHSIYPDAITSAYTPLAVNNLIYLKPLLPNFLSQILAIASRISRLSILDIFPIIGVLVMYFAMRKKWFNSDYDFIILNVGSYSLIVIMLFIPYLQVYYNFTRLYLQMFLVLSVTAVIGGLFLIKRIPRMGVIVFTIMVALIACSLNGSIDQITGGQARITLDQPQGTLDTFYIYDGEVASAQWLARNRDTIYPVQADVIAALRLQSFADIDITDFAIFPLTLDQNSYVYLIADNVIKGDGFYQYLNNTLVYNYPLGFVDTHKSLIYNNGISKIYK